MFDHIAECLANFMKEHKVQRELLPLGFTFSFPLKQVGLTKGLLECWTKGFNCSGVVGEDVVQLLQDAIARRGVSKLLDLLNQTILHHSVYVPLNLLLGWIIFIDTLERPIELPLFILSCADLLPTIVQPTSPDRKMSDSNLFFMKPWKSYFDLFLNLIFP